MSTPIHGQGEHQNQPNPPTYRLLLHLPAPYYLLETARSSRKEVYLAEEDVLGVAGPVYRTEEVGCTWQVNQAGRSAAGSLMSRTSELEC